ncbi:hypothetical protein HGA88_01605 [Candidatus Roizmanbacteria bacterium]|nr:hypothetical protein [Candidatus Roizmanbacteria bacterium]
MENDLPLPSKLVYTSSREYIVNDTPFIVFPVTRPFLKGGIVDLQRVLQEETSIHNIVVASRFPQSVFVQKAEDLARRYHLPLLKSVGIFPENPSVSRTTGVSFYGAMAASLQHYDRELYNAIPDKQVYINYLATSFSVAPEVIASIGKTVEDPTIPWMEEMIRKQELSQVYQELSSVSISAGWRKLEEIKTSGKVLLMVDNDLKDYFGPYLSSKQTELIVDEPSLDPETGLRDEAEQAAIACNVHGYYKLLGTEVQKQMKCYEEIGEYNLLSYDRYKNDPCVKYGLAVLVEFEKLGNPYARTLLSRARWLANAMEIASSSDSRIARYHPENPAPSRFSST